MILSRRTPNDNYLSTTYTTTNLLTTWNKKWLFEFDFDSLSSLLLILIITIYDNAAFFSLSNLTKNCYHYYLLLLSLLLIQQQIFYILQTTNRKNQ